VKLRTAGLIAIWTGILVLFVAVAIGIRNGLLFGSTVQVLVTQGPVYFAEIETYGLSMIGMLAIVVGLILLKDKQKSGHMISGP
jgi:F0F1-type ATP synthase membrane subunit c/vacuolar-type H+-ATPase subunit K